MSGVSPSNDLCVRPYIPISTAHNKEPYGTKSRNRKSDGVTVLIILLHKIVVIYQTGFRVYRAFTHFLDYFKDIK